MKIVAYMVIILILIGFYILLSTLAAIDAALNHKHDHDL